MNFNKVTAIATSIIAFSTFFGVLAAIIYYFYQIGKPTILEAIIIGSIYIFINLLFLYFLLYFSKTKEAVEE